MSSDSFHEAENIPDLTNAVYEVSYFDQTFDLKGWAEIDDIDFKNITLIMKKRNTDFYYTMPCEWLDHGYWTAKIATSHLEITKGTWDFYFQYDERNIRIKLDNDYMGDVQALYKQDSESRILQMYRTKKNSLSLKSSAAILHLDDLAFSKDESNSWIVRVQGASNSPLLNQEDHHAIVVKNRHTGEEASFSVKLYQQKYQSAISFDMNYQDIPGSQDLYKQTWDCYLKLDRDENSYWIRIAWKGTESLKESSGIQVHASPFFQFYFDTTTKKHVVIKLTELAVQNNVERTAFYNQHLYIEGFACLDAVNPDLNNQMERYVVVKRRKNMDQWRVNLSNIHTENGHPYTFSAMIPLKQLLHLGHDGKEIYDVSIQFQDQKRNIYEKKLGCEQYTYFKDGFIKDTTVKDKGYTRFYLAYTPKGNLKMETYPLTTSAYLYLKYGQKLDRKIHRNKEIWLIGERNNTAQDTGYHFFKYCREHYPDLKIYYVIDRDSPDRRNLDGLGNVVYSGTWKHARISSIATTFIGSHELDYILPVKGGDLDNYVNGKRVFLQHGVLGRKNVEYHKYYYRNPFHLFCVSSQAEKKLVQDKLQYHPDEVKITGLARFDHLLQAKEKENSILFIPTWRDWLNTEKALKNSTYFQRYQSLFRNPELHQLLEENRLTLNFYPHYRMQPFLPEFRELATDRMKIVGLGERNVQDLLVESRLMVTDYSSVSFDFHYMSKPVIFYHFDAKRFFKDGILRPVEETFLGDICSTEDQVIEAIRDYINNGFREKESVKEKKQHVFSHIDQQNNERIFQEITHLS